MHFFIKPLIYTIFQQHLLNEHQLQLMHLEL